MTRFSKVDLDITALKPKMKPLYISGMDDLKKIPVMFGQTTVQTKADGELAWIHIDRNEIYAVNRFGRKTEDLPALKELHTQFLASDLLQMDLLAEMYAVDENGKPLTLPNFIHYLKGNDKSLQDKIHLGLFDIVQIDFALANTNLANKAPALFRDSKTKFKLLSGFNGKLCHVLEWIEPKSWQVIKDFWTQKVEKEGWEGLVIRTNGDTWKAKPNRDIDAVILAINKNNKGFDKNLAKSVRVGLMREDGNFVELGDATVPSNAEASELFALTHVKVAESDKRVYVKPLIVVQINFISLFPDTINAVRDVKNIREVGKTTLVKMKSPRIVSYRKDKKPVEADIGLRQIAE